MGFHEVATRGKKNKRRGGERCRRRNLLRRVGLCTGQDGTSLQVEEQVQGEDGQWRHSFVLDLGQRARTADGKKIVRLGLYTIFN